MKRLCFIAPNLTITGKIASELESLNIQDTHVHVLGKHPQWVDEAHLHNASILQTTDLIPALKRGFLASMVIMAAIFGLFYLTLPQGVAMTPMAIAGIVIFSLFFGIWVSAMLGIGIPSKAVEASQKEIQAGHYLVMVDVPKEREKEITERILKTHPEVHPATAAQET